MENQTSAPDKRIAILDLSLDEMETFLKPMGAPSFRARQVFGWLYREMVVDFQRMTNVSKALRDKLSETVVVQPLELVTESVSDDKLTRKALFRLRDGALVEAVLMLYPRKEESKSRRTVCVSSQAGCGMGCAFCATGQGGLVRNLTSGEIAGQVIHFARELAGAGETVTNVVVMGQGEPLANFGQVLKAIETLNSPYGFGLGARHFTISTVGLVPKIKELARTQLQVGLAVSLHAPSDELRSRLMPVNERFSLRQLMAACREYVAQTHRRVTFEYALINGVNDSPGQARELAALVKGILCHVNLIPLNVVSGSPFQPSSQKRALAFQSELVRHGIATTVRVKRGGHIDAACGQLRARVQA
ncbi:MAG: 23S rRNA (adenine(2503)-C(2))-methyltransferase RlmN [Dehalococcoidales bacterium]|nr:23S rRNA (adenine(2503)-C(2))-methyltransferase RlmN [Dehalococcoidales bacterium]